jgi:high-affinity nickel-transport protein
MQEGQRPVGVGFFFALGHSTVVALAVSAIAMTATTLTAPFEEFHRIGGIVGGTVSALFLFAMAFANASAMRSAWLELRFGRGNGEVGGPDPPSAPAGLLTWLFGRMFRLVRRSWQMYPIGFLFALGFDTATEVALLGISAAQAVSGLSIWSILVLPALFAAGMCLVDTANGVLMLGAYGWAVTKRGRKPYYNLIITSLSVVVAFAVGVIQVLGLVGSQFDLSGKLWDAIEFLGEHFNAIGFTVVGVFVVVWLASALFYGRPRADRAVGKDA